MNVIIELADTFFLAATPLGSPFLATGVVLLLPPLTRRLARPVSRFLILAAIAAAYTVAFRVVTALSPAAERWLMRVHSPFFGVFLLVILPSLRLTGRRARRLFLAWPATLLGLLVLAIVANYRDNGDTFSWFPAPAAWMVFGLVSLLVLLRPLLSLQAFRLVVKTVFFLVLTYGGFALRQDPAGFRAAMARRDPGADFMLLAETVPVKGGPERMAHLPSAPCRFTADGGYVQGCSLELFQRIMQVDYRAAGGGEINQLAALNLAAGSLLMLLFLSFLAGRGFCGWVCPLHSLGAPLNWMRRRLGLPFRRLSRRVKRGTLLTGLGLASLTLFMARLYPYLDDGGRFRGCRLPLYPFCKICPGQQICPVAAGGPGMYAGMPDWDWGFGFFRLALVGLLLFFALSFALGRRWWCRLCPMGMISGLFNRGATPALLKDATRCNRCGVCMEVCPMDIDHVRREMKRRQVTTFDCVLCLKCVSRCPRPGCLSLEYAGQSLAESDH